MESELIQKAVVLGNVWKSKEIKTSSKLRIFGSNVKSVLIYGSEILRTTKTITPKLQTYN